MRDKTIDGFRAVAALGVVFAHLVDYRFGTIAALHYPQRLADPLAETSVDVFFVISGYIITTLLIKERAETGRITISAFYIRRICRIIPPLAALLLTVALLRGFGFLDASGLSFARASTFTCNIGQCDWWLAHTWSLSVEEQYYLVWPVLLLALAGRPAFIAAGIAALLFGFVVAPFSAHSNYISFACIGMGSLYASSNVLRDLVTRRANYFGWLAVVLFLVLAPLYLPEKPVKVATPFAIVYLIFAARELAVLRSILAVRAIQVIGLASYSLYLWQQLFLARPEAYLRTTLPLWALPLVVAGSVLFIERPFIRWGRALSIRQTERKLHTNSELGPAVLPASDR